MPYYKINKSQRKTNTIFFLLNIRVSRDIVLTAPFLNFNMFASVKFSLTPIYPPPKSPHMINGRFRGETVEQSKWGSVLHRSVSHFDACLRIDQTFLLSTFWNLLGTANSHISQTISKT